MPICLRFLCLPLYHRVAPGTIGCIGEGRSAAVTFPRLPSVGSAPAAGFRQPFCKRPNRDCRTGIAKQRLISNAARVKLARPTLLRDNLSCAVRRNPDNRCNVSQPDSSTGKAFARYPSVPGGTVPSLHGGGILCASSCLCSPLSASSLLLRPLQLALLRRSLRLRLLPLKTSTIDVIRQPSLLVRSWQATARPLVSGSAVSSSATLIASNVIVLSADPFGSQSPPSGNLGKAFAGSTGA
jgi:hypothetical protein